MWAQGGVPLGVGVINPSPRPDHRGALALAVRFLVREES